MPWVEGLKDWMYIEDIEQLFRGAPAMKLSWVAQLCRSAPAMKVQYVG